MNNIKINQITNLSQLAAALNDLILHLELIEQEIDFDSKKEVMPFIEDAGASMFELLLKVEDMMELEADKWPDEIQ